MSNDPRPMILAKTITARGTVTDTDKTRVFEAGREVKVFDLAGKAWLCVYADRVFYEAVIEWADLVEPALAA